MADQEKYKIVVRFGIARNCLKRLPQLRGGSLRAGERIHMCRAACGCEDPVQVLRRRSEALLVIRLTAQASHDDIVRSGMGAHGERTEHRQQQSTLHTTPHLRRSSHAVVGNARSSRNTMGMFQSSLVVRTEMPASE